MAHLHMAIDDAHGIDPHGRQLLLLAMASNWPKPEGALSLDEAQEYVCELAARLGRNVNMPNVAYRLVNVFDVDEDLEQLLDAAKELARHSQMLRCERHRVRVLRAGAGRECREIETAGPP